MEEQRQIEKVWSLGNPLWWKHQLMTTQISVYHSAYFCLCYG